MQRTLRSLLLFMLVLAATSLVLPGRYGTSFPRQPGPQFEQPVRRTYTNALNEQRPEVVLMGDSTLEAAVDPDLLEQQLGRPVMDINIRGSSSALWYLILKNSLLEAAHRPRALVFVIRDTALTSPGFRVRGTYLEQLDEFAQRNEPVVARLSFLNFMNPLEYALEKYVPLYGTRLEVRRELEAAARSILPALAGCGSGCIEQALGDSLGGVNLDPGQAGEAIAAAEEYLYEPELLDFHEQVGRSYLPEYVRMAQENGIQLIVVQLRTYPASGPGLGCEPLQEYLSELQAYLAQNRIPLLDFCGDMRIRDEYFRDPIHLNEQGRQVFTTLLSEALQPVLGSLEGE